MNDLDIYSYIFNKTKFQKNELLNLKNYLENILTNIEKNKLIFEDNSFFVFYKNKLVNIDMYFNILNKKIEMINFFICKNEIKYEENIK